MVTSYFTKHIHLKPIFFLLVFLVFAPVTHALSELDVSISRSRVELGKPVELVLRSNQLKTPLDIIDLNTIKHDFHIKNIGDVEIQNNQQTQKISLYPRKEGKLAVPALYFLNSRSTSQYIDVSPAIDPKDNSEIKVDFSVSTLKPWKKQQLLVKLELTSKSSILVIDTTKAYSTHSEIVELEVFSKPVNDEPSLTQHTTGWSIFPLQSGQQVLELPSINLVRDGVITHRFYPPYIELMVKPLPFYIPATMPVGKLSLEMKNKPEGISLTNSLHNIAFYLEGDGVLPSSLPSIVSQLESNESLSYYPANIHKSAQKTDQGLVTRDQYTINYKVLHQGYNAFGIVKLNYFDPDYGKIRSLYHDIGGSYYINQGIAVVIIVLLFVVSFFLLKILVNWLTVKWHCFSGYRKVLDSIPCMETAVDVKQALMKIARAENWHSNLTLQQWSNEWSEKIAAPCPVNINNLEMMLYSGMQLNINNLKDDIQKLCVTRWPPLKLFR